MENRTRRPLRHARDYAQAIVDAYGDVAQQRAIFEACPLELRALAREMAKAALDKLEARQRQLAELRSLTQAARQRDTTPYAPSPGYSQLKKSVPEVGNAHLSALRAAVAHPQGTPHA